MRDVHAEFRSAHAAAIEEMAAMGLGSAASTQHRSSGTAASARAALTSRIGGVGQRPTRALPGQTGAQGGSAGRIATLPGADLEEEEDAFRTNAVISAGIPELAREWASLFGDSDAQDAWWADHYAELGLYSCGVLLAPPIGTGGACQGTLKGNDGDCKTLACDTLKPLPDMSSYAADDLPVTFVDLRSSVVGYDQSLKVIIASAWTLLQHNLDLVRWASCWVDGATTPSETTGECLETAIAGPSARDVLTGSSPVDILIYLSDADGGNIRTAGTVFPVGMYIYGGHPYWDAATTNWVCGDNATRCCVALEVAALLLHELTHWCFSPFVDLGDDLCATSYVRQQVFRWALLRRYADVASSSCCNQFVNNGSVFAAGRNALDFGDICGVAPCASSPGMSGLNTNWDKELAEIPLRLGGRR